MRAQITANKVIASANLFMDVRHFCRKRNNMADINVPAWPMPTQKTKFTIAHPQPTGTLTPQTPIPSQIRYKIMPSINNIIELEIVMATYHIFGVFVSESLLIFSVTPEKVGFPWIKGGSTNATCAVAFSVLIDVLTITFNF